jgi:hypothetical protein
VGNYSGRSVSGDGTHEYKVGRGALPNHDVSADLVEASLAPVPDVPA